MKKIVHTVGIITALLFLNAAGISAQTQASGSAAGAWQIPFASAGNTISLAVQNSSSIDAKMVHVTFINIPSWIEFSNSTALIKSIPAGASGDAEFLNRAGAVSSPGTGVSIIIALPAELPAGWATSRRCSLNAQA